MTFRLVVAVWPKTEKGQISRMSRPTKVLMELVFMSSLLPFFILGVSCRPDSSLFADYPTIAWFFLEQYQT
jgi:hypothetical protein